MQQPSPQDRTQALIDEGLPINIIVCWAALDYKAATQSKEFAEAHGGEEEFQKELFKLVDQWAENYLD